VLGGRLRHPITIYEDAEVPDGMGGYTVSRTIVLQTKADRKPLSAYEKFQGMQLESVDRDQFVIRYSDQVQTGQKLECLGQTFRIVGVQTRYRRSQRWLELACEAPGAGAA
jgi:SPP1 family predicted phage head-tail adaptor